MEPGESGPARVLRDRYELLHPLGKGGMGEVFAAIDRRHGRRVAIKIIGAGERHESAARRFEREAAAVARLSHPHVAQLLDHVGATATDPALIVMELLDGETLGHLLHHQRMLEPDRALDIAAQIADALGAAHREGIVHRDIKPENVFLVRTSARGDFVKVLDFGIAKIAGLRGMTSTDEIVGTVEYMSPEQAMGDDDIGPASDVFSLGVLMYRMVSGALPHAAETMRGILGGLFSGAFVPLETRRPGLPVGIVEVITRCLALAPADRFADGAAVAAALVALRDPNAPRPAPLPRADPDAPTTVESRGRRPEATAPDPARPQADAQPLSSTRVAPRRSLRLAGVGVVAALAGAGGVVIARRGSDAPAVAPVVAVVPDAATTLGAHAASPDARVAAPPDAAPFDAAAPAPDAASGEPDPKPTSRSQPAKPRVQRIGARWTAIEFVQYVEAEEWETVKAQQETTHSKLASALVHCYVGTPIEWGNQSDRVTGMLRDGRVEVTSHYRTWSGRNDLAQPTSAVKACVAQELEGRTWPVTSEPAKVEFLVTMSNQKGRPVE